MCVSIHVSHIVCATHWCVISDTCMMMDEHIVADSTDGFSTISQSKENNSLCRWVISEIFRIYAYVGTRNGSLEDCRTPLSKIFECDRNWLFDCKSFRQVIWWRSVLSYLTTFSHATWKYLYTWCKDIQPIVIFCLFLSASWHPLNFLFLTCNVDISSNWSSVALEKIAEQITWKFFFSILTRNHDSEWNSGDAESQGNESKKCSSMWPTSSCEW